MDKQQLVLIGGGGHCRSCIDVIESSGKYSIKGILDKEVKTDNRNQYPVIGTDEDIAGFILENCFFLVTVGQVKTSSIRSKLFALVESRGGNIATVISATAYVSPSAMINKGTICLHHSLVNAHVRIGKNCIINNKALIEHDSIVGDHCHISTAAVVNGGCKVGHNTFIGSHSVLVNGVEVCNDVVVGAGSVVTKNITESGVYVGSPARKIN